jgi:cysteine sulfinate desulfinase/cysteine desulfurase-like protein
VIRFSLGLTTNEAQIDEVAQLLPALLADVRAPAPVT